MARRSSRNKTEISEAWRLSRPGLFVVIVFGLFVNALKFAMPLYLLQVLDRIPASRSVETLVMLTVITIAAIAAGLTLDAVRRRMLMRWGTWVERRFGPILLERQLAESSPKGASGAGNTLDALAKIRMFLSQSAVFWLDLVWAPIFIVGVYIIHPLLGGIAVGAVGLLVIFGILQDRMTREPRRVSGQANREANDLVLAAERYRESVGALTMAPNLTARWRLIASERLSERETIDGRTQTFRTVMDGLGQFLRIALLGTGIWLTLGGALTIGGVFAARIMAGFGFRLVERGVRNWRALREVRSSYRLIKDHLGREAPKPASVPAQTRAESLHVDALTHKYAGQRQDIVRRLSFELAPGEMLTINGAAASGKTTLSRLLVGLLPPRFGNVRLGDIDITRLPPERRAALIGYASQHTEIFAGTVRDNIARMSDGPFEQVIEAAKMVGIHDLIKQLPDGYDTAIDSDAFSPLSGSQRKRIAIARAFYMKPRLIVLDEPSANLDRPSRRVLEAAIQELKAEGCMIIVTQSIESNQINRIADKVLALGGDKATEVISTKDASEGKKKVSLRRVK